MIVAFLLAAILGNFVLQSTASTSTASTTETLSMETTFPTEFLNVAIFGNISSQDYPNYDYGDQYLAWQLYSPNGQGVSIQFMSLNLQNGDYINIFDQYNNLLTNLDSSSRKIDLEYSDQQSIFVHFYKSYYSSCEYSENCGFLATYSLPIANTITQDVYSGYHSILSNSGYPGYQANLDTVWILRSNCQSCILISFVFFNFNNNADFLTIYNGDSVLVNSFTSYTDTNSPYTIWSNSQSITFRFTTSQASSNGGFQFYYTIYDQSTTPFLMSTTPVETESTTSYIPSYRLVTASGQTNYPFGRVEISQPYYGQWGTICSNYWSNEDAEVVCRMMGYRSGNAVGVPNSAFGQGSGNIVMTDVRCSGSENNIFQCQYNTDGYNCNHYQDASVICTDELVPNIPSTNIPMITCSGHGEPVCNCIPGYSGQHCQSKIGNFCNDPVPDFPNTSTGQLCQPNGYCMETETQAVCICHYGYSGEFCQTQNPNQLWTADRCTVYETF